MFVFNGVDEIYYYWFVLAKILCKPSFRISLLPKLVSNDSDFWSRWYIEEDQDKWCNLWCLVICTAGFKRCRTHTYTCFGGWLRHLTICHRECSKKLLHMGTNIFILICWLSIDVGNNASTNRSTWSYVGCGRCWYLNIYIYIYIYIYILKLKKVILFTIIIQVGNSSFEVIRLQGFALN